MLLCAKANANHPKIITNMNRIATIYQTKGTHSMHRLLTFISIKSILKYKKKMVI